jgi:pyruvate formate lyase activating enzyme
MLKPSSCVACGACEQACPVGIHRIDCANAAIDGDGAHHINRSLECIGCNACVDICPTSALKIAGEYKTISQLVDIVMEDKPFYEFSGGGVTLGGGEVTSQPDAAISLLTACKQRGVNTAIETCGYVKPEILERFKDCTDLFLYDIKAFDSDRHQQLTGVRNELILENLKDLLSSRSHVKIRMPLLHERNDYLEDMEGLCDFIAPYADYKTFKGVDLLPYHKLGVGKYSQLDMSYSLDGDPVMSEDDLRKIETLMKNKGIQVSIIKH